MRSSAERKSELEQPEANTTSNRAGRTQGDEGKTHEVPYLGPNGIFDELDDFLRGIFRSAEDDTHRCYLRRVAILARTRRRHLVQHVKRTLAPESKSEFLKLHLFSGVANNAWATFSRGSSGAECWTIASRTTRKISDATANDREKKRLFLSADPERRKKNKVASLKTFSSAKEGSTIKIRRLIFRLHFLLTNRFDV